MTGGRDNGTTATAQPPVVIGRHLRAWGGVRHGTPRVWCPGCAAMVRPLTVEDMMVGATRVVCLDCGRELWREDWENG